MRSLTRSAVGAAIACYTVMTNAALSSYCPDGDTGPCFQWGVPEAVVSSGSGNVYFQLKAPIATQWVALGSGTGMTGASMFVVYQDGNGNVTLSTRKGTGHVMPRFVPRSDVELLQGSGVVNGNMVANVRCSDCSDIDISNSSGWIAAWKKGPSLDSPSTSEAIAEHDEHHVLTVDLASAGRISADSNPFLSPANNTGTGGNGVSGDNSGVSSSDTGHSNEAMIERAHGIIMSIVFIVGYPVGSVLMPLIGNWIIHASWQMIIFLAMWAAFGLGYTVAQWEGIFFKEDHTRLGVIVCSLMGLQPILGWLHHKTFVQTQSRSILTYIHVWYGRCVMILGIVNGGLGLRLANASNGFIIAYSVVAAVFSLLYVAGATYGIVRTRKQANDKIRDSPQGSDAERKPGPERNGRNN